MDEKEKRVLNAVEAGLDTHCNILKYQVLNNLDVMLLKSNGVVRGDVDKMVKGPLMRSVAQIQHSRELILSLLRELPQTRKEKKDGS